MNIVDNRNSVDYQFSDLTPGDCFELETKGSVYMVIEPWTNQYHIEVNAINLTSNNYTHFNPSQVVIPLNVELVIK